MSYAYNFITGISKTLKSLNPPFHQGLSMHFTIIQSMAITRLSFACRHGFHYSPSLFHCFQKMVFVSLFSCRLDSAQLQQLKPFLIKIMLLKTKNQNLGDPKALEWKKWNSKELGISNSTISRPTKKVLDGVKKNGYEVYLVGGCVRDLILKRTPKDFDIITSAELKEVVRTFPQCIIVGKRFPICHVHIGDTIVEVSSFSTTGPKFRVDLSNVISPPIDCDEKDYVRWKNCLRRDLTINGLVLEDTNYNFLVSEFWILSLQLFTFFKMFDIYVFILFFFLVRTVIPASTSFQEDCARILRAQRIMMEMNYMLAYGSAEASLRILWKFGLLELLLPFQAAYFVRDGFKRRDKRSNMLLCLFSNLDKPSCT
ncbi:hypothetical protein NC653_035199 [Populus alba x Populus x berolinensis]|uniref:Poly(A) polymerase n=1 Tax=Populus alba x Populus x berolinensis TaxID=444605 RepID=A0AAD6LPC9_9ROSI|nr:hypothetical protein NC653_035199 [Populus alba x Populus x berolinensis]